MSLPERSKKRIMEFYREADGVSIPIHLIFDSEFSPSEKVGLSLIAQLCMATSLRNESLGQYWTDFTNGELDRILGGVSVRSLHRHFKKFRQKGLIKVDITNSPRPNSRTIYMTPKGVKYFFNLDVGESITVSKTSNTVIY